MKTATALFHACAALAMISTAAEARQMHADIDYARYLQEKDAVADELDTWMSKFGDDAEANGWLPQAESRDADEVTEDRKQRFFMAKQLVSELKQQNPDADFSTDSPFSLMTTDEFSKYIKNSYLLGGGRQLRVRPNSETTTGAESDATSGNDSSGGSGRAQSYNFGEALSKYWIGNNNGNTKSQGSTTSTTSSFSFQDLIDWINNNNSPNIQPVTPPSAPTTAPSTSRPRPTYAPSPDSPPRPVAPTDAPSRPVAPTPNPLPVAPTDAPGATPSPAAEIGADGSGVDWSKNKCMPPVQNQGQCGSCWSFATIAGTETGKCIATKASSYVKLSEQNLAACDTRNMGCNGGATSYAFQYIQQNGVCSASDVPYTMGNGRTGTCTTGCTKIASGIKSTSRVQGESGLVSALNSHPVVIAVAAGNAAWKQYRSGVISSCQTSQVDHAVLAVGYDATTFKIRNSWGANWGEAGYIRMKRNSDSTGVCSMYRDMIHANF